MPPGWSFLHRSCLLESTAICLTVSWLVVSQVYIQTYIHQLSLQFFSVRFLFRSDRGNPSQSLFYEYDHWKRKDRWFSNKCRHTIYDMTHKYQHLHALLYCFFKFRALKSLVNGSINYSMDHWEQKKFPGWFHTSTIIAKIVARSRALQTRRGLWCVCVLYLSAKQVRPSD